MDRTAVKFTVIATWDDEARVWVAESDDVPGLVAEAETIPLLVEKLRVLVPELLEENDALPDTDGAPPEIPVEVIYKRTEKIRLRA